ncbi:hypothetical protein E4U21_003591 [Claviceps maximensis]|nr:hypothetical protein E4U21_003591 [Claviceps maximensis]
MVRIASTVFAVVAAIAPVAVSAWCTEGVHYCGSVLSRFGDYHDKIDFAVDRAIGYEVDRELGYHDRALFRCLGGGEIEYLDVCHDSCLDFGDFEDDRCDFFD